MELIRGLHNLRPRHRGCAITIGNFDGLHIGHQTVLNRLQQQAQQLGVPSLVMTFEPQPLEFFQPDKAPARLTRLREKIRLLAQTGIDRLLCLRFDADLAAWSGQEFVQRLLVDSLAARLVIVGDDFRFGRGRDGDFAMLRRLGAEHGFEVAALDTCNLAGERVSSSRVREALANGDMQQAAELLDRPYTISGRVVHGDKRGREFGIPTLNIDLKRIRPAISGVFTTRVHGLTATPLAAVSYIGRRLVFDCERMVLETHLLDHEMDCYGQHIEVEFLHKLRAAQDFNHVDALLEQMQRDLERARAFFKNESS